MKKRMLPSPSPQIFSPRAPSSLAGALPASVVEHKHTKDATEGKILMVEDNEDFALGLSMTLRRQGFRLAVSTTLQAAKEALSRERFEVILLDLSLPDASGVEVVSIVRNLHPDAALLVLTGHNDAELAVQTLRLGAQDYLTKPISSQVLLKAIDASYKQVRSRRAAHTAKEQGITYVIGDSPNWQATMDMLYAAAQAPRTTVLLTGEPGVGKEIGAQILHQQSARAKQPMVAINMACLPGALLEAELFGYEAGAFTGATHDKRGVFEQADGGTLFLDEIGELPVDLQAKLLRVLEGKPFRRLGGERDLHPDVRLVSATNRDLKTLVAQGSFREDLYHRLKVLEIHLPPLRERGHDIDKLALHFLARLSAEMGQKQTHFSPEALATFRGYAWPGNIRELRNVVERALVLSQGSVILPHHLPQELQYSTSRPPLSASYTPIKAQESAPQMLSIDDDLRLDTMIYHHIKSVLALCDGNISKAAERLGITRQTLRRRLKQMPSNP